MGTPEFIAGRSEVPVVSETSGWRLWGTGPGLWGLLLTPVIGAGAGARLLGGHGHHI